MSEGVLLELVAALHRTAPPRSVGALDPDEFYDPVDVRDAERVIGATGSNHQLFMMRSGVIERTALSRSTVRPG